MSDYASGTAGGKVISSRLSPAKSVIGAVTALVICIGLFVWLSSLNLRLVRSVKTACPYEYPGITYEQAFGKYYSNPKWEDASADGWKTVRFTGECDYQGTRATVVLDFHVGDREFKLYDGTINGDHAAFRELAELCTRPFETYGK